MQKRINDITPQEWDNMNKNSHFEHLDKLAKDYGITSYPAVDEYNKTITDKNKASTQQIGGNHYKGFKIQPAEFCYKNGIPYLEATAIKYLCRWRDKGGIQDLDKAIHFIELLKEFESADD